MLGRFNFEVQPPKLRIESLSWEYEAQALNWAQAPLKLFLFCNSVAK